MAPWLEAGEFHKTTAFVTADQAPVRPYIDVRSPGEFARGHVPGAINLDLGELTIHTADAPDRPVVACGHGERGMTAASVLERAGRTDITVLDGGPADYAAAHGQSLQEGPAT